MPESTLLPRRTNAHYPLMQYRKLGRTGLEVSVIGFGASPLGGVFGPSDANAGTMAVHLAIDEGINYFDVSPYYGMTLAEERLGQALVGRRDKVVLSTKCGRYGPEHFDFSASRVRLSLEESLNRLRTDHVDLLLAHDVEFGDVEQIIGETLPAMQRLQEEGKTRYIGISGYPLKVLVEIVQRASVDSILSYCRYNLLIDDMDTMLIPIAQKLGAGVINAAPLHMGLLSERGAPDWHPAPPELQSAAKTAQTFCQQHGINLPELALRFCVHYPHVASTLVGMATPDEVLRNLRAISALADSGLVNQIKAILAPVANVVWPSGRPENRD